MSGQQPVHPGAWTGPAAPPTAAPAPAPKISTSAMLIAGVLPLLVLAAIIGVRNVFVSVSALEGLSATPFKIPFIFVVGMLVFPLTIVAGLVTVGLTIATLVTRRRALLHKALVTTAVTLCFPLMVWLTTFMLFPYQ